MNIKPIKIGERIKSMRLNLKMTQKDVSEKTSIQRGNLSHYEKGNVLPSAETIIELAKLFNVSTDWLLTGKDYRKEDNLIHLYGKQEDLDEKTIELIKKIKLLDEDDYNSLIQYLDFLKYKSIPKEIHENEKEYHTRPILGYTAAGEPLDFPDGFYDFTDLLSVPSGVKADFALKVRGDSMEPLIRHDSTILVKRQPAAENGSIVIASINKRVTCKKFYKKEEKIELKSLNPKYPAIVIKEGDNVKVEIIGIVII